MKPDISFIVEGLKQTSRIFSSKESMWNFDDKNDTKQLASVIDRVFAKIDGVDLYPDFMDKMANLFYFIVKNHMFPNGNKRTAVIVVLLIFVYNGSIPALNNEFLYGLAQYVAESANEDRDYVIISLKSIFVASLVPVDKPN